jgi:polyphosphate glucokinase
VTSTSSTPRPRAGKGRRAPRTLAVDCGGTGLKASVLDTFGAMVVDRVRVPTPYPCPPERFVATLVELVAPLPAWDRASVGMPGMLREGKVVATPHYVTEAGPFTPRRPDLVAAWAGFDVTAALTAAFECPTKVVNDAEVQGSAVIVGKGLEAVITLGTGVGFALFDHGRLVPHIELSHHPFRKGETYDQQLGNAALKKIGKKKWNRRVRRAIEALRSLTNFDRLYIGGGNAKRLDPDVIGPDRTIVPNISGLLGGIALWERTSGANLDDVPAPVLG